MAESLFEKERRKQKENKKKDRESGLTSPSGRTGGKSDKRDSTTRDYGYNHMGGSNDRNKASADEASMPKKKKSKY